jgi:hypothetical protein
MNETLKTILQFVFSLFVAGLMFIMWADQPQSIRIGVSVVTFVVSFAFLYFASKS